MSLDSQLVRDGRLVLMRDKSWREDASNLPHEEVDIPIMELPDAEPDNGNPHETLKEIEMKWTDLALSAISNDNHNAATTSNAP